MLPRSGGYWCDDGSDTTAAAPADPSQTASCKLELDETARCYRRFFVGKVSDISPLVSVSFSAVLFFFFLLLPLCSRYDDYPFTWLFNETVRKRERETCFFSGGSCCYCRVSRRAIGSFRAGIKGDNARPLSLLSIAESQKESRGFLFHFASLLHL